jgi:NADH:ubiquinone oxidoreductase subunit B-like Fe-S oxidoreductase
MSCQDCSKADKAYPFRWGFANILIVGCPIHSREVMEALHEQRRQIEAEEAREHAAKDNPVRYKL